jgi:tRNA (cmo5U34)-methyltransferase
MLTPPDDWTFKNRDVAQAFNAHVREQLPWYDMATGAAAHIARHYLHEGGLMYDIGASTGNLGNALRETIQTRNIEYVPIDNSPNMLDVYDGPNQLIIADALDFKFERFDVAVMFLCLMFLDPARRKAFIKHLTSLIKPGGALIVFDKMEVADGYLATIMHRLTIAGKVATGVPSEQIIQKELSLCGIQRPLPYGFFSYTCPTATEVFRFGEFAGFVITAGE